MREYTIKSQNEYNTLNGLFYRFCDLDYMNRIGAPEAEKEKTRQTISSLFDDLDAQKVPFWVQNVVCGLQNDYTLWKTTYLIQHLKKAGINCENVSCI